MRWNKPPPSPSGLSSTGSAVGTGQVEFGVPVTPAAEKRTPRNTLRQCLFCRYLSCASCRPSPRMGTCYDADLLSSRVICYTATSIRGTVLERGVSQPLWPRPGGGGTRATVVVAGSPCHRACIANLQCDPGKGRKRGRAQQMSETCFCRRSPILWDQR